jgi:hypothetical protein
MRRTICLFAALASPFLLSSCGVYQAVHDDEATQGYSGIILLNPITAITGDWPSTEPSDPLDANALIIRRRNHDSMTPERAKWIRESMARCFSNKQVQMMSRQQLISLFGIPDAIQTESGRSIFIYRIRGGTYGEGRLIRLGK